MTQFVRFQDIAKKYVRLEGDKRPLGDILNKEILILGFTIAPSKFAGENSKDCVKIQWAYPSKPEEKFVVFTGSRVLLVQLRGIEKNLEEGPVLTTIRKEGRYFTFT